MRSPVNGLLLCGDFVSLEAENLPPVSSGSQKPADTPPERAAQQPYNIDAVRHELVVPSLRRLGQPWAEWTRFGITDSSATCFGPASVISTAPIADALCAESAPSRSSALCSRRTVEPPTTLI
jgi:hypothetical protein